MTDATLIRSTWQAPLSAFAGSFTRRLRIIGPGRPESELRKPVATSVGLGAKIGADHERLEKRRVPLTGGLIAAAGRLRSASLTGAFSTRSDSSGIRRRSEAGRGSHPNHAG